MFSSAIALTEIVIPEGVTEIQQQAFWGCTSLTDVTLPSTLTTCGLACFEFCGTLEKIALPASLKSIPKEMFAMCYKLENVALPEGLEEIGDYAFELCYSLDNISLPYGLKSIGASAFIADTCLTTLGTIPESLETIGERAFGSTYHMTSYHVDANNPHFTDVDGVLYDKYFTTLVAYPNAGRSEYVVPNGTLHIAPSAFYGANRLKEITFPEGLQDIGSWAFWSARSLQKIEIPEGITTVTEGMLRDCTALTEIILPSTLTTIESQGLSGCAAIEHIDIPESVSTIDQLAFNCCLELRDVVIPDNVTELPLMSFNGWKLERVVIGRRVNSLGVLAFGNDEALLEVHALNPTPATGAAFHANAYENATLFVPEESKELYETAAGWKDFKHINTEVSGINGLNADNEEPHAIYNLHGQITGKTTKNLRTGIYVINGKKIFVK